MKKELARVKNLTIENPNMLVSFKGSYGGQFHYYLVGVIKRKFLGMDGFGGQQILINFDLKE